MVTRTDGIVTQWTVQIRERYLVDEVRYTEEMADHLHSLEDRASNESSRRDV